MFFLVAGALSYSCGTRLLPRLRGVLHTLPLPGVGFCVAALAITGVPPFNGFFSKFPLFAAGFALSVEYWILLPAMILLMIESVASFAWFIGWFGPLRLANRARPSPMPHRCQGQCAWC
ncbi:proton-conducting transporter membrane subunit [Escherichia coli]